MKHITMQNNQKNALKTQATWNIQELIKDRKNVPKESETEYDNINCMKPWEHQHETHSK